MTDPAIGINHLPVSAARWQHWYWICYSTIILQKITNLLRNQQPQNLKKKEGKIWNPFNYENCFEVCATTVKNNHILLNKLTTDYL
jgi:hypothetical protein